MMSARKIKHDPIFRRMRAQPGVPRFRLNDVFPLQFAERFRQGQRLHIHLYRTGLEFAQIHNRFKAAIHFIDGLPQTEEDFPADR